MVALLGTGDELLRIVESELTADVHVRGNQISLTGEPGDTAFAVRVLDELVALIRTGQALRPDSVRRVVAMMRAGGKERPADVLSLDIISRRGPHDPAQDAEPEALRRRHRHQHGRVRHRPGRHRQDLPGHGEGRAGAADQERQPDHPHPPRGRGRRAAGLPAGTLSEKIDPYLRPLYDALHDMVDPESIPRLMQSGTIEVAPLAYMRGRTLNDAFVILDEAQNTTAEQMKMFLTRLGFGSKMVVTGDVTQVDLPGGAQSGLRVVRDILTGIDDVHFSQLTSSDVVRHRLVGDIVDAYERWDTSHAQTPVRGPGPRRQKGS